jgi:hypothetical protein
MFVSCIAKRSALTGITPRPRSPLAVVTNNEHRRCPRPALDRHAPAEVCTLQAEFIGRNRTPWLCEPPDNKTQHLEKDRRVSIGPKARELPISKSCSPAMNRYS